MTRYYFESDKEEYNDIPTGVDISRDYNQASNVSSDSLIKMRAQWTGELKQFRAVSLISEFQILFI
ncbi:hypothetical protein KSF78_0009521 [Schistosoma japonicum]|nr:hypothetical protein KSF78_0009521 [Schistosoma japonicum]